MGDLRGIGYAAPVRVVVGALVALSVGTVATGCFTLGQTIRGSGDVMSETRSVSGLSVVAVTNQGDLEIKISDEEKLVVTAEANLLPHISSDVRGGKLVIGTVPRDISLRPRKPIRYTLFVRSLEGVETSSSGDIHADRLGASRFSVRTSSSGDIEIGTLQADELTVSLSSSGDVSISSGSVDVLHLSLSSSGDYDGEGLGSRVADVSISSSGDAAVDVKESLEARLSSSGNLRYRGDPKVDSRVTSSGDLRRMR